jgi:hypothetical protein
MLLGWIRSPATLSATNLQALSITPVVVGRHKGEEAYLEIRNL